MENQHQEEIERALHLSSLEIDYQGLNGYLDDITALAASISGAEISLVNLIDLNTQWTVSNYGLYNFQLPREDAVCSTTILHQSLEISDLRADPRFKMKSYVVGEPNLRYYYGVPLKSTNGINIGALCVLDQDTIQLNETRKKQIQLLAETVVKRIESFGKIHTLQKEIRALKQNYAKVGHDIRTPINGIMGMAGMIEQSGEDFTREKVLKMAKMIHDGAKSVLDLSEDIMSSNGYHKTEYDITLSELGKKLKSLYQPQATLKSIQLKIEVDKAFRDVTFSKSVPLHTAGNLISNSIKFTPQQGQVRVCLEVKHLKSKGKNLVIKVNDSGVGLDEETRIKILKGQQSSSDGTGGEKGYGFGLHIVNRLVQKAGGSMKIESTPGEGAAFEVQLPI